MIVLQIILIFGALLYFAAALAIRHGLSKLNSNPLTAAQPFVSVLVPARNEEKYIRACLESIFQQEFSNFEVIVINDNSQDRTLEIAQEFSNRLNFRIENMQETPAGFAPKKAALALGVKNSKGEIIVTTDADCVVPKAWLSSLASKFDDKTGAVLSWLKVKEDHRFFSTLESLDALLYSFIGAGLVGIGRPLIASGANFAYRKKVFDELHGFNGQQHYVSGDDDLFLQKIARDKTWKIRFQSSSSTLVTTSPVKNVHEFISQRLRWASKGPIYPNTFLAIQIGIYLFFLSLLIGFCTSFFQPEIICFLGFAFFLKIFADFILFSSGKKHLDFRLDIFSFLSLETMQILYILFAGVGGLWGQFTWKGRKFTHGKVRTKKMKNGAGKKE